MPTKEQWLAQAFVRFFYAAMNGNDSDAGANLGAVLFECRGCDEELMAEAVSALVSAEELPEVLEIARGFMVLLKSGRANPMELVLKRHITREADEYLTNSISAVVSKMVEEMGVHLSAGESIEFIILDQSGKKKPEKAKPLALYAFEDGYDIEQYTELALRAVETLLLPFGYDVQRLKAHFRIDMPKRKRLQVPQKSQELPLFRIQV